MQLLLPAILAITPKGMGKNGCKIEQSKMNWLKLARTLDNKSNDVAVLSISAKINRNISVKK